jgi:ankyrin repeat protein
LYLDCRDETSLKSNLDRLVKIVQDKLPQLVKKKKIVDPALALIAECYEPYSTESDTKIAQMLYDPKVDNNQVEPDGTNALMAACQAMRLGAVMMVLKHGKVDVTAVDERGDSALHYLLRFFDFDKDHDLYEAVEIMQFLKTQGLDIDAPNNFGVTPLMSAVHRGHARFVRALITMGADLNVKGLLHEAASCDHAGLLAALLATGHKFDLEEVETVDANFYEEDEEDRKAKESETGQATTASGETEAEDEDEEEKEKEKEEEEQEEEGVEEGEGVDSKDVDDAGGATEDEDVSPLLEGQTPLQYATNNNHLAQSYMLLLNGANPNGYIHPESQYNSPLANAAFNNNVLLLKLLLSHKADVNVGNPTPLMAACTGDAADCIGPLLDAGADLEQVDDQGNTPLLNALTNNSSRVVLELLKHGASLKDDSRCLPHPVIAAIKSGNKESVEAVLAKTKWHIDTTFYEEDSPDLDQITPLAAAAEEGDFELVKLIYETFKASIDGPDPINVRTPLARAIMSSDECTEYLVSHGASLTLEWPNGSNTVNMTCCHGFLATLKILVEKGNADLTRKDKRRGYTPLMVAVEGEWVIDYSGNAEEDDNIRKIFCELVSYITSKLDPEDDKTKSQNKSKKNMIDQVGGTNDWTALHLAAARGKKYLVPLLILAGADVNKKDKWGNTPLDLCELIGWESAEHAKSKKEMEGVLISAGGKRNMSNGYTSLVGRYVESVVGKGYDPVRLNDGKNLKAPFSGFWLGADPWDKFVMFVKFDEETGKVTGFAEECKLSYFITGDFSYNQKKGCFNVKMTWAKFEGFVEFNCKISNDGRKMEGEYQTPPETYTTEVNAVFRQAY